MAKQQVVALLDMIDQAFDKPAWHGTNLKGSLRGVTARRAARRPKPGRHNIWELVVHAAYWKHVVYRRITGGDAPFAYQGKDWFARPVRGRKAEAAWRSDIAVLDATHRRLRRAVAKLTPRELRAKPRGSRFTARGLVVGAAAHDLYHTGQIQLIKRLLR